MRCYKYSLLLLVIYSFVFQGCDDAQVLYDGAQCFTHVNTIDTNDGLQKDITVVIKDNKIIKTGPTASINLSNDNNIIDASGKYMIPGLWDAHVHFAYMEELAPSMFHLFLTYGITSVRDTGGKIEFVKSWKDKANANPKAAPIVKIAGPLIDGLPNVYDGSSPERPPLSVGAGSVEEAVKIVDYLDSLDVDLIKAYEMLTPEQFKAITKRAKELGLKVTGHVPLSMDVISAADAGMNSIEHFRNIEMSCAEDWESLKAQRLALLFEGKNDQGGILRSRIHEAQRYRAIEIQSEENTDKVLDALLRNDTWQIPTLALISGVSGRAFADANYQKSFAYLPPEIEEEWKTTIAQIIEKPVQQKNINYTNWTAKMVDQMHKKGINFMAGTDCPIFFLTPGHSLHIELQRLVESGLQPIDALAAATSQPAKYFGMQDSLGYIDEGMIADLILLDANPLESIQNTLKINTLVKDGKIYTRQDLDALQSELDN